MMKGPDRLNLQPEPSWRPNLSNLRTASCVTSLWCALLLAAGSGLADGEVVLWLGSWLTVGLLLASRALRGSYIAVGLGVLWSVATVYGGLLLILIRSVD